MDPKKRINELTKELLHHQYLYYVKSQPEITDAEYDRLIEELAELEKKYPEFAQANSPCSRIGSDLDNSFPEREHTTPVLSLDKVYSAEEAVKWMEKIGAPETEEIGFVVEEKIDGASIALYYDRGELQYALTRGNGFVGNEVTENVRTIRQVPLRIAEVSPLSVRGEIFLNRSDFEKLNKVMEQPYANPRNLAAGSLRNIHSSLVARIPLQVYIYEGLITSAPEIDHMDVLYRLSELGFRINPRFGFFCDKADQVPFWKSRFPQLIAGSLAAFPAYISQKAAERRKLPYEIDGLVLKVNQSAIRRDLGYTAHHPRWAMAVKYDAPQGVTRLKGISIQIGRNGRVTPVAELDPVRLSGSLISRATLHNQDYINLLELGIGDQVAISKRGDVIPAVEKVMEKDPDRPTIYKIQPDCPFCGSVFIKSGAHLFCPNENCPERRKRILIHFASKSQMDIETLGEKTISFLYDRRFVREIPELFTFDYNRLLGEEGYKKKKIRNILENLEKSKKKPFVTVLTALGLEGIGSKAAEILIENGFDSIGRILETAAQNDIEAFSRIEGIGPVTAALLIRHFTDRKNIMLIKKLQALGLNFRQAPGQQRKKVSDAFAGQAWVITGSFKNFQPRDKAAEEIKKRGGRVLSSVTSKTTHLLTGAEPGSKLKKAKKLGLKVVSEEEFLSLLKG